MSALIVLVAPFYAVPLALVGMLVGWGLVIATRYRQ